MGEIFGRTGKFRFRQGKSCVTNLLSFYTRVIEGIDNRGVGGCCLSRYQKRLMEIEANRWTERKSIRMDARL